MAIIPAQQLTDTAESRKDEIKELVEIGKIDRAITRLLDYSRCFTSGISYENQTILLSAEFNNHATDVRKFGESSDTQRRLNRININILELVDEIYTGYTNTSVTPTPDKQTDSVNEHTGPVDGTVTNISDKKPELTVIENKDSDYFTDRENHRRRSGGEPPTQQTENDSAVFRCNSIGKTYAKGGFHLSDITMALEPGKITGLVGENGNGKTTLLRIIAGEILTSEGNMSYPMLNGSDIKWHKIKRQIAYVEQSPDKWYGSLQDNLHYAASTHGLKGKENRHEVEFVLHRLGLDQYRDHSWDEISGGYKMRFELARALVSRPKLLILDEPLAPLDIKAQRRFLLDLRDLANYESNPISVIASSQHLYEMEEFADQILFLREGKPEFCGQLEDLRGKIQDNLFELECSITRSRLQDILMPLDLKKIIASGERYNILVSEEVGVQDVLQILVREKVNIKYFRDISTSTRRMFDETIQTKQ